MVVSVFDNLYTFSKDKEALVYFVSHAPNHVFLVLEYINRSGKHEVCHWHFFPKSEASCRYGWPLGMITPWSVPGNIKNGGCHQLTDISLIGNKQKFYESINIISSKKKQKAENIEFVKGWPIKIEEARKLKKKIFDESTKKIWKFQMRGGGNSDTKTFNCVTWVLYQLVLLKLIPDDYLSNFPLTYKAIIVSPSSAADYIKASSYFREESNGPKLS